MAKLSELEGAVLGEIWAGGPCTAYAVRVAFIQSPSPFWSGSAGAIYPLIDRLQRRGLLSSKRQESDARGGRLYRLTNAGLKTLRGWLEPPLPDWAVGVPVDPLRTRLGFLGALAPARRAAFISDARSRLAAHIETVRRDCRAARKEAEPYHYLVARGALAILGARRSWLREVERALAGVRKPPTRRGRKTGSSRG